jgi:CRP-like cAMP-binding protein
MRAHRLEASGGSPRDRLRDGGAGNPDDMTVTSAWARRLACYAPLSTEDQRLIEQLGANTRQYSTDELVVKAGDPPDRMFVVLDGLCGEFKLLPDGRRQILPYLLPGDMTDPRQLLMPHWDHSICVLWPARIATLPPDSVQRLEQQPNLRQAIARYSIARQAIAREWLVNVGNRTAFERLGHLLCETYARLKAVGLANGHAFELPLTQVELADTLALSAVHVNRTLMDLRRLRLVTFQNRHAAIHDHGALCAAVGFDSTYLHA